MFQLGGDSFALIIQTLYLLLFFILIFFGQRIQLQFTLIELGNMVNNLDRIRRKAHEETLKKLESVSKSKNLKETLDRLLESFVIFPESMDPSGIVKKLEHIVNVRETRFINDVKRMIDNPEIAEYEVKTMSNMVEAALALNMLYKIALHYYLLAKKTNNYFIAVQLQMQVPLIYNFAKAYLQAIYAFKQGAPVGDTIGPLVVNKLSEKGKIIEIKENYVKDTNLIITDFLKRKLYIIKAKGPGGNVGKPGEAIKKLLRYMRNKFKLVIMIDAALKLEGEKTGSVAEGIGAAIGGIGVEKFKIEEVATKYDIPLYAIIIKMSLIEAIAIMKKEIAETYEETIKRIERVLIEETKEGDYIIVAGIGNSIGVP